MSKVSQPSRMSFSFGEIEAVLSQVNFIANDKRTAFQARLKNLLKLGLLPDVQVGRGRAATYSPWHLFQIGLALEYAHLGVPPGRTVEIFKTNMNKISRVATRVASVMSENDRFEQPYVISFDAGGLVELQDRSLDSDPLKTTFAVLDIEGFQSAFAKSFRKGMSRVSAINVTALMWHLGSRSSIKNMSGFYNHLYDDASAEYSRYSSE